MFEFYVFFKCENFQISFITRSLQIFDIHLHSVYFVCFFTIVFAYTALPCLILPPSDQQRMLLVAGSSGHKTDSFK